MVPGLLLGVGELRPGTDQAQLSFSGLQEHLLRPLLSLSHVLVIIPPKEGSSRLNGRSEESVNCISCAHQHSKDSDTSGDIQRTHGYGMKGSISSGLFLILVCLASFSLSFLTCFPLC